MPPHRHKPLPGGTPSTARGGPAAAPVRELHRLLDTDERRVGVLGNGLTVILGRHDTAPVAAVRVYVRCGSACEGEYGGAGVSHLLEHLIAGGGAAGRTERQCADDSDALGGLCNAYTTSDHTCYHITTAKSNARRAIELVANWLVRPELSAATFQREVGVILREIERDADDPEVQLDDLLRETIYRVHPLRYPTIGYPELLRRLRPGEARKHYLRQYVPDNTVVVVTGDIDLDETIGVVAAAFADFPRRAIAAPFFAAEPPVASPRLAEKRMRAKAAWTAVSWLTAPDGHPDVVALDVAVELLVGGDAARMVRRLRWSEGLAYEVGGSHELSWCGPGYVAFSARCDARRIEAVEEGMLAEIDRLAAAAPGADEMDRVRARIRTEMLLSRETADGLAAELGEDYLATFDAEYSNTYLADLERLTPQRVSDAAARYFSRAARVWARILPAARARRGAGRVKRRADASVSRFEMENGLRCLTRRTSSESIVALAVHARGGALYETAADCGVSNFMAEALFRGTESRDGDALAAFFESRGAIVGCGSGLDSVGMMCTFQSRHLDEIVPVFAELFLRPSFDAAEIDRLRPVILDAIDRVNENWQDELGVFADRCFFGDGPYGRARLGTRESIERLTGDDLRRFHARVCHAPDVVVAVCGAFDDPRVRELLREHFGRVPRRDAPPFVAPDGGPAPARDRLFVRAVDGERQMAGVFVGFRGTTATDRADRGALAVLQTLLGGYVLSSGRLFHRLRGEGRDLVYDIGVSCVMPLLPGVFSITAGCQPRRAAEVIEIIRAELEDVRSRPCELEEIERAQAMITAAELDRLQTAPDLVRRYSHDELLGLGAEDVYQYLGEVGRVGPVDVQRVARKYLTHAVIAVLTPEPDSVRIGLEPEELC